MNAVTTHLVSEPFAEPYDPLDSMAAALFRPMGVDGVYARTPLYEEVDRPPVLFDLAPPGTGDGGLAVSPGHEPPRSGEVGLSEKLPQSARVRLRAARNGSRNPRRRRPGRDRGRLDSFIGARRSGPLAGRVLSRLSAGGEPRSRSDGRPAVRCCLRLFSAGAVETPRSPAVVPHARICLYRLSPPDHQFP